MPQVDLSRLLKSTPRSTHKSHIFALRWAYDRRAKNVFSASVLLFRFRARWPCSASGRRWGYNSQSSIIHSRSPWGPWLNLPVAMAKELLCTLAALGLNIRGEAPLNPSTGSSILLHQREAGVILTPRILWCILLVLSGVLNANQLISPRRNASSIILLYPRGGIVIRHVCLFVRLCVREHVLGRNILKKNGWK